MHGGLAQDQVPTTITSGVEPTLTAHCGAKPGNIPCATAKNGVAILKEQIQPKATTKLISTLLKPTGSEKRGPRFDRLHKQLMVRALSGTL